MQIGIAIKKLRKESALTQINFCDKIGITQSYLSQIESGLKKPSLELLEIISDFFAIPLPILFWFCVEINDIPDDKKEFFKFLKPSIDRLIESIY